MKDSVNTRLSDNLSLSSTVSGQTDRNIEKNIFEHFPALKDEKVFHNYFSSYDFHENERDMVNFWKDVLIYVFQIKGVVGLRVEDILNI